MRPTLLAAALALTVASAPMAQQSEPDFYLLMKKCSTTVGYLVLSEESLRTVEGTPVTHACVRRGKAISCRLAFADGVKGVKGNSADYMVSLDSPPLLLFADAHSGDWTMVDTTKHAAVMITRVVDAEFAGSKVCQGSFATQSEIEALRKK